MRAAYPGDVGLAIFHEEGYAMRGDTVVQLRQPGSFEDDPLTEVLRLGARRLLGQAVEAEVAGFVEAYAHLTDSAGRRRIVRHGHLREREIQTGIGPVAVRCPRVRDRGAGERGPRLRFTSRILPPNLRRAKSIEKLLPWLYLKGICQTAFNIDGVDASSRRHRNVPRWWCDQPPEEEASMEHVNELLSKVVYGFVMRRRASVMGRFPSSLYASRNAASAER